jgi:hypothetical protein
MSAGGVACALLSRTHTMQQLTNGTQINKLKALQPDEKEPHQRRHTTTLLLQSRLFFELLYNKKPKVWLSTVQN